MAGQLIPPAESAPPIPQDATPEQCIALWVDLMNACEQFLFTAAGTPPKWKSTTGPSCT